MYWLDVIERIFVEAVYFLYRYTLDSNLPQQLIKDGRLRFDSSPAWPDSTSARQLMRTTGQ